MNIAYTVALCTHNHAMRLARKLDDLTTIRPTESPWELLIIDNGSRHTTAEVLASYAWPEDWCVRVAREEKLGLSNARNRAILEGRGDYVIFFDDDETPDPDWLRAHERLINTHTPDAFGGRVRVILEDRRPRWLKDELLGFLGELDYGDTIAPLTEPHTPFYG